MGNRDSSEQEFKEWQNKKIKESINIYGKNIYEDNKFELNKNVEKISKTLKITGKTFIIIMTLIIVVFIAGLMFIFWGGLYNRYGSDVIKNVEKSYGISLEQISEEKIDYGRLYKVKTKVSPQLEFYIIRNTGNNYEDYYARLQKYYFEKWNNKYKNDFYVTEKYDEYNMLYYSNYIIINDYEDIKDAVPKTYEFRKFVEKENKDVDLDMLDIYLKKDKDIINIYIERNINLQKAINIAENEYNSIVQKR